MLEAEAMMFEYLVMSAVVPSLLLLWFFHARDLHPEPQRVVWATFGLGVLTTVLACVIELPIQRAFAHVASPFARGTLDGFFCAALVEEALKMAVVVGFCMRHREFDEPMDGIVYGAVASLGFATLENVLYVAEGGFRLAAFRAVTAVPGHACMGAIMGYFVGQAKFDRARRGALLAAAFFVPFLLHGLYDAPLLSLKAVGAERHPARDEMGLAGPLVLVTVAVLVVEIVATLVVTSRLRGEQRAQPARTYVTAQPSGGGRALGWVMIVAGVLFSSGGGFMTLGTVALLARGTANDVGMVLVVGALFGALPLAIGLVLFALGVRRVRGAAARAVPAMRWASP